MDFMKAIGLMYGERVIDLSNPNIISLDIDTTSKGNQQKYYDTEHKMYIKEQFEYQNTLWCDYKVEYLSCIIANMLNTNIPVLQQDIVKLSNGRLGCISKDFAIDKQYVPLAKFNEYRELVKHRGKSYKVFQGILDIILKCNIPRDMAEEYLFVMIILDYLLGNEDRHYNNIGLLYSNKTNEFSICPLFDFGIGLFEHDNKYKDKPLHQCIAMMDGKPFDEDLSKPIQMIKNVDIDKVKNICCNIIIPNKDLFPNDLSYEYFQLAYRNLMEGLK